MSYSEAPPPPHLAPYIEALWTSTSNQPVDSFPIHPDGCMDILLDHTGQTRLIGAMPITQNFSSPAGFHIKGIRFHPALYPSDQCRRNRRTIPRHPFLLNPPNPPDAPHPNSAGNHSPAAPPWQRKSRLARRSDQSLHPPLPPPHSKPHRPQPQALGTHPTLPPRPPSQDYRSRLHLDQRRPQRWLLRPGPLHPRPPLPNRSNTHHVRNVQFQTKRSQLDFVNDAHHNPLG